MDNIYLVYVNHQNGGLKHIEVYSNIDKAVEYGNKLIDNLIRYGAKMNPEYNDDKTFDNYVCGLVYRRLTNVNGNLEIVIEEKNIK